jgi:hypothetical protein
MGLALLKCEPGHFTSATSKLRKAQKMRISKGTTHSTPQRPKGDRGLRQAVPKIDLLDHEVIH